MEEAKVDGSQPETVKVVLYTVGDSPPGKAVEIVLKHLDVPFRIKTVDWDNGEFMSEEYLKMYPQGEIPVLDDDGLIIGESAAILLYLVEKYGKAADSTFYPINDLVQKSVIHHRLCFLVSTLQRRVYDYMILPMDYDYPRTEENRIKLTHALAIFDEFLKRQQQQGGLYAAGEHFTIADPPLIMSTCALVAMDDKILEPFPAITKWFKNFQDNHPELWAIAKVGLDGLSYYNKNPRDMSHLKHPIHPIRGAK